VESYLSNFPENEKIRLSKFSFPTLVLTARLRKIIENQTHQTRERRKGKTQVIVKDLPNILNFGLRRFNWGKTMYDRFLQCIQTVLEGETKFPVVFKMRSINLLEEYSFRVWNYTSWVETHKEKYSQQTYKKIMNDATYQSQYFVQYIGDPQKAQWFLEGLYIDALTLTKNPSQKIKTYFKRNSLPINYFHFRGTRGIIQSPHQKSLLLYRARNTAADTFEDSRILFDPASIIPAITIGFLTLLTLILTGMRIGEFQQIAIEKNCLKVYPPLKDKQKRILTFSVYTKGKSTRQDFVIPNTVMDTIKYFLKIHDHLNPDNKHGAVGCEISTHFRFSRYFKDKKAKFILQWGGRHLPTTTINKCLTFLLLGHSFCEEDGPPVFIRPHHLRHGIAGYLHQNGASIQDVMKFLNQLDSKVTEYYAEIPRDIFYEEFSSILTTLGVVGEWDSKQTIPLEEIEKIKTQILNKFGFIREVPGGNCGSSKSCPVLFKCATCPSNIPDPSRMYEVEDLTDVLRKEIELYEKEGLYFDADQAKKHLEDWLLIIKQMEMLEETYRLTDDENSLDYVMKYLDESGDDTEDDLNEAEDMDEEEGDYDDEDE
jgi:integrase